MLSPGKTSQAARTKMEKVLVDRLRPLLTAMVKVEFVTDVGRPEITPLEARDRPGGSMPRATQL